jgi:hypothetical protein
VTIELRIKRLDTGESLIAAFESLEDAKTWIAQRPKFMEVLGVVDPKAVGEEAFAELRDAARPLDDEERAKRFELQEGELEESRAHDVKESERWLSGQAAAAPESDPDPDPASLPPAEPDALMLVRWRKGRPLANVGDNRPVPDRVRTVVDVWIAERNKWLHPQRRHVGEAELEVWPEDVPSGDEADRIEDGASYSQLPGWADG